MQDLQLASNRSYLIARPNGVLTSNISNVEVVDRIELSRQQVQLSQNPTLKRIVEGNSTSVEQYQIMLQYKVDISINVYSKQLVVVNTIASRYKLILDLNSKLAKLYKLLYLYNNRTSTYACQEVGLYIEAISSNSSLVKADLKNPTGIHYTILSPTRASE